MATELQQIEMVRGRLIRAFTNEIIKFRSWLSATEGNAELLERLRGQPGDELAADLVELTLQHLGHTTEVPSNSPASQTRKAITAGRGAGRRRATHEADVD